MSIWYFRISSQGIIGILKIKNRGEIMRKVFLENIPKIQGIRGNKNRLIFDWKNLNGYVIKFIYDDIEGYIEIKDFETKTQMLTIIYKNEEFKIKTSVFKRGCLGSLVGRHTPKFKISIGTRFQDDKRDIETIDKKREKDSKGIERKYYKYKCNKCGFDGNKHWNIKDKIYKDEYWVNESHFKLREQGCSCCSNHIVVENINSIYKTDPWMIPYIGEECAKTHTHSSGDKVKVTCPDCGRVKNKKMMISTIYINHSIGCVCGDGYSYGHKYIHNLLTQLGQDFIDNYTFDWCRFYNTYKQKDTTGEYDFVLEQNKLIIEVDGAFHRKDNNMDKKSKEESIFLDSEKDRLANEHGYKMIRIIYNDNNIDMEQDALNSEMINLFDLSNINWTRCEKFALSNRVKEACELKRLNPNYFTTDIATIMNISSNTVKRYLKKGHKLYWCHYNVYEEKNRVYKLSGERNKEKYSKPISMLDINMNLIYMFSSAIECEKQSEKLFGIKLNHRCISVVCKEEQKQHRNYIFKFVTKEEYNKWLKEVHNQELGQAC
jgi:very-short-patch-repair endonuclease/predicted transcriptional regulator